MRQTSIVVIGRNEEAHVADSLRSCLAAGTPVLYVDSGSTDRSCAIARDLGVPVLELDPARPFSAARGRNEGFAQVMRDTPTTEFVQFVDGDCELHRDWIPSAVGEMEASPTIAAVAGSLTERRADATVFHRLCALEWERPAGDVESCGGIFLARASSFGAVGGFRDDIVAGEEQELCLRWRRAGFRIRQLTAPMASHDAAIDSLGAWWRRTIRCGHGYAQLAALHGAGPERYCVRECRRAQFWALALPVAAIGLAPVTAGASLLALWAYPLQFARVFRRGMRRGWTARDAALYAGANLLGKAAELQGQVLFRVRKIRRAPIRVIEYRRQATPRHR